MSGRFRLATVERLRAETLDAAARGLALARQGVTTAVAHRDDVAARLADCVPHGTTTSAELQTAQARRVVLREELDAASEAVTRAREQAAEAVARWSAARADLKAVEVLHERHREAARAQEARREQRLLDDLAGTRRIGAAGERR